MKVVFIFANKHISQHVKTIPSNVFLLLTVLHAITEQLHIASCFFFYLEYVHKLEFVKLHFTKLFPVNTVCSVQRGKGLFLESYLVKSTVLSWLWMWAWWILTLCTMWPLDGWWEALLVHSIYRGIYTHTQSTGEGAKERTVESQVSTGNVSVDIWQQINWVTNRPLVKNSSFWV